MIEVMDQFQIQNATVLILTETFPVKGWKNISVDGQIFECHPVMSGRMDSIAVPGAHNFLGKSVTFV